MNSSSSSGPFSLYTSYCKSQFNRYVEGEHFSSPSFLEKKIEVTNKNQKKKKKKKKIIFCFFFFFYGPIALPSFLALHQKNNTHNLDIEYNLQSIYMRGGITCVSYKRKKRPKRERNRLAVGTACVRTFSPAEEEITLVTFLSLLPFSSYNFFRCFFYNLTPVCNLTPFTLFHEQFSIILPSLKLLCYDIKRFRFVFLTVLTIC